MWGACRQRTFRVDGRRCVLTAFCPVGFRSKEDERRVSVGVLFRIVSLPRVTVSKFIPRGFGWIPDLPDPRDYSSVHEEILPLLRGLPRTWTHDTRGVTSKSESTVIPDQVDLRYGNEGEFYFTEVEDQGAVHSSTAFTVLSLVEYFERRIHGRTFDPSRMFLYKVTRNLRNKSDLSAGDSGADLRTTLKALRQFGIPSEELWPYDPGRIDIEPTAFVYQSARKMGDIRYFRVEPNAGTEEVSRACSDGTKEAAQSKRSKKRSQKREKKKAAKANASKGKAPLQLVDATTGATQWELLTSFLAAGFPIAFGFSVPSSITCNLNIPFRPRYDTYLGGSTAVAIGYDLHHFGRNQPGLLVRSTWGSQWGDRGNGWISEAFVRDLPVRDCWTLLHPAWIDSTELACPHLLRRTDRPSARELERKRKGLADL